MAAMPGGCHIGEGQGPHHPRNHTPWCQAKGFEIPPRRLVADRTFAWIFKNRRIVRSDEQVTAVA